MKPGSADAPGVESQLELARLPVLHDLVLCRETSSHDRRGGNDNGFSNKAEFVRREPGLGVCIADVAGPGCVQSAWFGWPNHPQQPRFLEPLWKRILGPIRFFFDGEPNPRLDLPLGNLIGTAPFNEPLAFDGDRSGGGIISYVPVPFSDGLRISVAGGKVPMFFFHLWYHVYPHGTEVASWNGREEHAALTRLCSPPPDPFSISASARSDVHLAPGETRELFSHSGSGTIRVIRMRVPQDDDLLRSTWLLAFWNGDDRAAIEVPLSLLFALENRWTEDSSKHVSNAEMNGAIVGIDGDGRAYFRLPMPFTGGARLVVENRGTRPIVLDRIVVEHDTKLPADTGDGIGFLHCEFRDQSELQANRDVVLAELGGHGKIVGLVMSVHASETFLEGDERITTDGCRSPHIMGDATETYFGGGWYFYEQAFACPLHGAPTFRMKRRRPGGDAAVTMYRFHVTDWVPYRSSARFTIQHGPFNDVPGHYRSVVWSYGRPDSVLAETDRFRPYAPDDRHAHRYEGSLPSTVETRSGFFEGENNGQDLGSHPRYAGGHAMLNVIRKTIRGMFHDPSAISPARQTFTVCEHRGSYEFTAAVDPHHRAVMLRRLFDQNVADQRANVEVDGELAGVWFNPGHNRWKIWIEDDLVLDPRTTRGKDRIRIRIVPVSSRFTAVEYSVLSILPPGV